ncbi:MAG: tetratricopeptide repeat protein [Bacteroidales bacterium]|nr:tetratricopeptide repeat protein [Bacteroidales bacterium]
MKHKYIYIFLILAAVTLAGCKGGTTESELTDSEKLELLDIKLEKSPKDAALLAERARILINLGRSNDAIRDADMAVKLKPKEVDYRLLLADAYFTNGNASESYKALTEAERLAPDNLEVQLKMGELTFYSRDYDRSLLCLTHVTEREPDNRTALFMKGYIYKERGDTAEAVILLRKVCDLYPDYEPAFEELGVLYANRLNPMAADYLNTALQLEPNNTNAMYALAMYHQERQEMDEAEALYRRMLDVNSKSADAWHNLGYIELTFYHDYDRAITYFDSALASNPSHEAAMANRQLAIDSKK